jgi:hypothetical protein
VKVYVTSEVSLDVSHFDYDDIRDYALVCGAVFSSLEAAKEDIRREIANRVREHNSDSGGKDWLDMPELDWTEMFISTNKTWYYQMDVEELDSRYSICERDVHDDPIEEG